MGKTGRSQMCKASSPRCMHCPYGSDTAEHTIFHRQNYLDRRPKVEYMLHIMCGPIFKDQPERRLALKEAEETFRIFYKMVKGIPITDVQGGRREDEQVSEAVDDY